MTQLESVDISIYIFDLVYMGKSESAIVCYNCLL